MEFPRAVQQNWSWNSSVTIDYIKYFCSDVSCKCSAHILPMVTGSNALQGHVKLFSSMKMTDLVSPGWIILLLYQKKHRSNQAALSWFVNYMVFTQCPRIAPVGTNTYELRIFIVMLQGTRNSDQGGYWPMAAECPESNEFKSSCASLRGKCNQIVSNYDPRWW